MRLSKVIPALTLVAAFARADNGVPNVANPVLLHTAVSMPTWNLCMGVKQNINGEPVETLPCNQASDAQRWTFSGGSVKVFDSKCLDIRDGINQDGAHLQIWDCGNGNPNQQFYYTNDGRLAWTGHGKCLDLPNGCLSSGNPLQVWSCGNGNINQAWDALAAV